MIKVIKSGKIKFKGHHICKACDAVLEYELDDLQYSVSDQQALAQNESEKEIIGDFYIRCPECETLCLQKNLPENVKRAVLDA